MAGAVFQRVEKKYLLQREQYEKIVERLADYMEEDDYAHSTISNIYYDTPDYELVRRSIDKPVFKEKLRLRVYGKADEESEAFVEIKRKYNGVVYKRRIALPLKEAEALLNDGETPQSEVDMQILGEIQYFLTRYPSLSGKIYLAYDRLALRGIEEEDLRITFDKNIRARETSLTLQDNKECQLYFSDGEVIMEIKMVGAYPMWLVKILEELEIYPASFSKYGAFYKRKLEHFMAEEVDFWGESNLESAVTEISEEVED